jgi:hypothetical protein
VPACSAFDDACGAVEERLDFRDHRLLRKDSRVLRGIGVGENAGDFRRLTRLRTGEPRQSAGVDAIERFFLIPHWSNLGAGITRILAFV